MGGVQALTIRAADITDCRSRHAVLDADGGMLQVPPLALVSKDLEHLLARLLRPFLPAHVHENDLVVVPHH